MADAKRPTPGAIASEAVVSNTPTGPGPLSGVRITDFTWAGAGPYAILMLALRGAEVIKISSGARATSGWSLQYIEYPVNVHKKSITLNLATPKGADLAKRLVAESDVVMDNFRPGVMKRFGLAYEDLRKVKEDIIMVEVSALGNSGPHAHYAGYAPIFSALGGLASLTGYPGGEPSELRLMVDYMAGTAAAFATQAALVRKKTTGLGTYIDTSVRELCSMVAGEAFLDYLVNNHIPPRIGNRDIAWAPHGVYPCRGDDAWISIAVTNETEWRALCEAMGKPELAAEDRFAEMAARWRNQEQLDAIIGEWTSDQDSQALMHELQRAGVAAVPSFSNKELFEDAHLKTRAYPMTMETAGGPLTMFQSPWVYDGVRPPITEGAADMGQHNEEIFCGMLGLQLDEMKALVEEGVIS